MNTRSMRGTAFASDYDGTLCQSNWETGEEHFEPADLEAIRRYQAAGGLFGVCTGRPLVGVTEPLQGILDLDFYIVVTGAQVLDRNGRTLFERMVDREVAAELYRDFGPASDVGAAFVAVTDKAFVTVGGPFGHGAGRLDQVASLDDVPGKLYDVSLEMHGNADLAREACAEVNARFGDVVEGFQNIGSVDIVPKGCSKGAALDVLRASLGVTRIAGIGDSYNDLPLLDAADVSYTFHHSPESVRGAATHAVPTLASAIEHFCQI